ncbi:MAG: hypothetical protein K8S99_05955 [Planctomycetes bacterium]|nr:hypothetical protein [Planctomycetota bacterium]
MKLLTDVFISAVELLEAEARDLRRGAYRLGAAMGMLTIAVILGAAGILAVGGALFMLLQWWIGPIGAAAIVGAALMAGAGGLWWTAHGMINNKK